MVVFVGQRQDVMRHGVAQIVDDDDKCCVYEVLLMHEHGNAGGSTARDEQPHVDENAAYREKSCQQHKCKQNGGVFTHVQR